jgi:hypothetical protein
MKGKTEHGLIIRLEYYSPLERREVMRRAATWLNMEDIVLSELTRHKRTNTM